MANIFGTDLFVGYPLYLSDNEGTDQPITYEEPLQNMILPVHADYLGVIETTLLPQQPSSPSVLSNHINNNGQQKRPETETGLNKPSSSSVVVSRRGVTKMNGKRIRNKFRRPIRGENGAYKRHGGKIQRYGKKPPPPPHITVPELTMHPPVIHKVMTTIHPAGYLEYTTVHRVLLGDGIDATTAKTRQSVLELMTKRRMHSLGAENGVIISYQKTQDRIPSLYGDTLNTMVCDSIPISTESMDVLFGFN